MAKGKPVLSFDQTKRARFGILPRYAKDDVQIRWFELPNCNIFHNGKTLLSATLMLLGWFLGIVMWQMFNSIGCT